MDVGRANDFLVLDLLQAVGTPARHARRGEEGGVEIPGDAQHLIHQARVQVDIGGEGIAGAVSLLQEPSADVFD